MPKQRYRVRTNTRDGLRRQKAGFVCKYRLCNCLAIAFNERINRGVDFACQPGNYGPKALQPAI